MQLVSNVAFVEQQAGMTPPSEMGGCLKKKKPTPQTPARGFYAPSYNKLNGQHLSGAAPAFATSPANKLTRRSILHLTLHLFAIKAPLQTHSYPAVLPLNGFHVCGGFFAYRKASYLSDFDISCRIYVLNPP